MLVLGDGFCADQLKRDVAFQPGVVGLVDHRHPAHTEAFSDTVAINLLSDVVLQLSSLIIIYDTTKTDLFESSPMIFIIAFSGEEAAACAV